MSTLFLRAGARVRSLVSDGVNVHADLEGTVLSWNSGVFTKGVCEWDNDTRTVFAGHEVEVIADTRAPNPILPRQRDPITRWSESGDNK